MGSSHINIELTFCKILYISLIKEMVLDDDKVKIRISK